MAHSLILQRSEPAQYGSKNLWILYHLYITNYCSNYIHKSIFSQKCHTIVNQVISLKRIDRCLGFVNQPQNQKPSHHAGDQKLQSSFGRDVEREEPKKSTETGHPGSSYSTQPLSPVNDSLSLKISGLKSLVFDVRIGCLMHYIA